MSADDPTMTVRGRQRPTSSLLLDASAVMVTLGAAAACWLIALPRMKGMDMGVATTLGSFSFFVVAWVSMMAAMMLPGALPAVLRNARQRGRVGAVPLFTVSYLGIWTLVGLLVYALYRPHGATVAGLLTIAVGFYELTPLKARCRRQCRADRSGLGFGLYCVGSSGGLMLLFLAVGAMSITWMCVIAALVLAQKLLPPRAAVDVPFALAIVGLGVAILIAPSLIPGLMPSM
jgi:predicted metal-binding membrane protein